MRFSLLVLTHNKLACTRRCLAAVARDSRVDDPWEMVVVDNGSTDGTRDWLEREFSPLAAARRLRLRVIANDRNAGCSTARNQAIAAATGRYFAFLDNDVCPRTRDWLPRLAAVCEAHPGVAFAAPKLVYPAPPHRIQCAGVGISRRGHVCFRGRGEPRDDPRFNRPGPVQCLISACLLARADLVRAGGGFDEAFNPVQFEDFDLIYRLRQQGWQAYYQPEVEMYHFESVTTQGTATLANPAVVVRNGLTFQRRWRQLFAHEDGPAEEECRWKPLPPTTLEEVHDLPLLPPESHDSQTFSTPPGAPWTTPPSKPN
jgi:GT2 family glycosyltransferase